MDRPRTDHLDLSRHVVVLDEVINTSEQVMTYSRISGGVPLKEQMKGPILCFVGPPGVGKTSLGPSLAGPGAEICSSVPGWPPGRGKIVPPTTYVWALPWRFSCMLQAGSAKPVFILYDV